ncbi:MAG TPA: protoglobin domain-containing protein [Nitrospira sp.]|nr:protoglobin domain-containing protein [Nitrospira sp.]
MSSTAIPGYIYGTAAVPRAPISLDELDLLKQTLLFSEHDVRALQQSRPVVEDQVEAILDVWYGFVASNPHLLRVFTKVADGQPDPTYLAAVRKRFAQWILDTAAGHYDQVWLDYQFEIGRRHHRTGKNKTDKVAAVPHIPYRYLPALLYPVTATLRPFLEKKGHSEAQVDAMHQAWIKSVLLQVILWSHCYIKEGDF